MDQTLEKRLRGQLSLARRHAHTTDAERADLEAQLLRARAEIQAARASAARAHATIATKTAALHHLEDVWRRWYVDAHTGTSERDFILGVGADIQAVIEEANADGPAGPGDAAWGSVWLHGNWQWLTKNMTTPERELAADAVARWSAALNAEDSDLEAGEPEGLRWWRDA
ncbi:hypothetical protein [Streptomyces sp. NPDC001492]